MSRNEEEMQLADAGSRGPWFPAKEFLLEQHLMNMVRANFNFTMDLMATYKNRLTEKYFSAVWEAKSAGKNFFLQKIENQEFGWYFPPPRIFWPGMKNLKNERAKGVEVFSVGSQFPWLSNLFLRITYLTV